MKNKMHNISSNIPLFCIKFKRYYIKKFCDGAEGFGVFSFYSEMAKKTISRKLFK
jgi:hypothetical protein